MASQDVIIQFRLLLQYHPILQYGHWALRRVFLAKQWEPEERESLSFKIEYNVYGLDR